jgi:hypothetical protein
VKFAIVTDLDTLYLSERAKISVAGWRNGLTRI